MKLSAEDVKLFFRLMWDLQLYVNSRLEIIPDISSQDDYLPLPYEEKTPVRNAVYDHPELIDAFVAERSGVLPGEELEIVRSWKRFVRGKFYIERYLKRYSIWIGEGDPGPVYGVWGLTDSLNVVLYERPLPILVQGVLLPFKGKIIYDGMLSSYSLFFGGNIKRQLREEYMIAKQNRRIIESLEPGKAALNEPPDLQKDWGPKLDAIVKATNKLRGEKEPVLAASFSLLKASARMTQAAGVPDQDMDTLWREYNKVVRSLRKLHTVLERAE